MGGEGDESEIRRYGEFDVSSFTELEMRMYVLIKERMASMWELKEVYTLDEALKLYALYRADTDIANAKTEEAKREAERGR